MVAVRNELPDGASKVVTVAGRSIGVFNSGGRYFALRNICPHHGAPLCEGPVSGQMRTSLPHQYELADEPDERVVRCPWHGFAFRLADGQSTEDPASRVRTFRVELEGDEIVLYA